MDTQSLLNTLDKAFQAEQASGLLVDRIGLALAYPGLVANSYVLGVSAPSLAASENCYDKSDRIIDVLFARLTPEERSYIDRVRVYSSAHEFERHAQCNFDNSGYYGYCEAPLYRAYTREISTPA